MRWIKEITLIDVKRAINAQVHTLVIRTIGFIIKKHMKKVLFITISAAVIALTSCGSKTTAGGDADSTIKDTTALVADTTDSAAALAKGGDAKAAPATAAALTKEIQEKITAKDAKGLTTLLMNAKAKIAQLAKEDPAAAKAYVSQLQQYVSQHAAELKTIVAGNATITQAIDEVKSLNPEKVVNAVANATEADAKNIATSAAETAKSKAENAVNNKVNEATTKAAEAKTAAQNKVNNAVTKAQNKANDAVNKTQKKANDAVNKATDKALKGLGL